MKTFKPTKIKAFLTRPLQISIALLLVFSFLSLIKVDKIATYNNQTVAWTLLKEVSGITVYYKIINCEEQNNFIDPTTLDPNSMNHHEIFQLKFVNENSSSKSISFSKITMIGDSEMKTISISLGTTILES